MAKKIPVSESTQPLSTHPFAGLDLGPLPEGPEQPGAERSVGAPEAMPKAKGRVVLRREKSQRGGKTVVVVSDFDARISLADLEEFARRAKRACGCGGTVAGREIELQGDDPARVRTFFEGEGFRVVGAGSSAR